MVAGCGSSQEVPAVKMSHVGFLSVSATEPFIDALQEGLRAHGYVKGETMTIDWRVTRNREELPGIVKSSSVME